MLSQFDAPLGVNNTNRQQQQQQQQQYAFDFVNADDFLDSISGALPSDGSSDQQTYDNMNVLNATMYSPVSAVSGDDLEVSNMQNLNNYTGQNFNDYLSDNSLECYDGNVSAPNNNQNYNANEDNLDIIFNPSNKRSGSTSTNSSNNDGATPISNYSAESILTSPEPPMLKQEPVPYVKQTSSSTVVPNSASATTSTGKKTSKITKPKAKDKNSHNMIEKKYRTNINTKIMALRDAVPALRIAAGCDDVSIADLEGLTPASKLNKASVLTKATEYIKHLEAKNAILKQQNMELQRLIQQANLNPQSLPPAPMAPMAPLPPHQQQMVPPPPPPPQQQQQHQEGFGFYPPQNQAYNSAPVSQFSSPQQSPQQQQQQRQGQPNKFLLGGMAAVMGTSLFGGSGENDFRSLSALPFSYLFPNAILNPSPLTIQMWTLTKLFLVIGSLASIIIPMYKNSLVKKDKNEKTQVEDSGSIIDWGLISFGLKIPQKLTSGKRDLIIKNLQGGNDWTQLISDYFYLNSCEINFENCFLSLLIGSIIKEKLGFVSPILNHYLIMKSSLVLNLDYKGKNASLIKLNQLIGKIDGVSMFASDNLIKRLTNVFIGKPINSGVVDGQNHVKYIDFYQNEDDYFGLVCNWRLLEIIHELNLTYLEELNQDKSQILTDLTIMGSFIQQDGDDKSIKLFKYYQLFNSILNVKYAPYLFESIKSKVESSLDKFRIAHEGFDLTDHEIHNTSSEDEYDEEETEAEYYKKVIASKFKPSLRSQKSLISSLNLVDEEEFIILTSALVIYYYENEEYEHALKMLNYLRLNDIIGVSLLTFTALVTLINELIPGKIEDNDNLDLAIKISRDWLNNEQLTKYMEEGVKSKLTKLVVNKGMIVNGLDNNESDDE
ncbi:Transcription factor CPH2 [Candida tropicalis]